MADDLQEEEWLYGESVKIEISIPPPQISEDENEGEADRTAEEPEDSEQVDGDGTVLDGTPPAEGDTTETSETAKDGVLVKEETGEGDDDDRGGSDDEDEDSDDDGVQVVIGDVKTTIAAPPPTFSSSKRPPGPPPDKKGKFAVEDFEGTGTINGVPAQDFSLDAIEEKPWRKPGADITDYFNYGFTEETWRAYCDRQKRLRYDSGSALPQGERERKHQHQGPVVTSIPTVGSDKYGGPPNIIFPKKFGMHDRGPKEPQRISRIREEPRENTIQVMTADRREYSRKQAFDMPPIPPPFDMSVPPPSYPPIDQYHGGGGDFFNHPPPQYYREEQHVDYEEQQWMDSAWDANMSGPGPSGAATVIPLVKVSNLPLPPGEDVGGKRSPSSSSKEDKPS